MIYDECNYFTSIVLYKYCYTSIVDCIQIDLSLPPKLSNLIVGQRDIYEGLAGFIEEFVQRVEYKTDPSHLYTYRSAAK